MSAAPQAKSNLHATPSARSVPSAPLMTPKLTLQDLPKLDTPDTFVGTTPPKRYGITSVGIPRLALGLTAAAVTFTGTAVLAFAGAYATGFLGYAAYMSFTTQVGAPMAQLFAMCFWPGATLFAAAICRRVTRDLIFLGAQFKDLYRTCKADGPAAARHLAYDKLSGPCLRRTFIFAGAAGATAALSLHPVAQASLAAMAVGYGTLSILSFVKGSAPAPAPKPDPA